MTIPLLLPGRKRPVLARALDLQRISKPQWSLLILVSTALVIASVLLVWLLLWISRPRIGIEGWWIAQRGLIAPVLGYQPDDLGRIVRPGTRATRDISDRAIEQTLRGQLARAGRRPVVVYLSAVGVSDDQGAFLLSPEPGSLKAFASAEVRQWLVTPQRLIDLFADSSSSKKLLILDAGQVGTDRNLGVFANGFLARLKSYLETKPVRGLAVLSSCEPGQTSWVSETDRNSVFGYYVAQGLSGAASGWDPETNGLTVRGLGRYVRQHVSRWVGANRQAEQTPILLGDPAVNFLLPRATPSRTPIAPRDPEETERLLARLDEAWVRRDALEARHPYRHTPLQWRRYLETLLGSERRIRVGNLGEAAELLDQVPALEKTIADAVGGLSFAHPWSLALLNRELASHPSESRRAEGKSAIDQIDESLSELTLGDEDSQPIEAEPTGEPLAPPTKPDTLVPTDPAAKRREGPVVSTKRQGVKPSGEAHKADKAGNSSLGMLIDRTDKSRPNYVEAQLLVWADTFVKRSGASYAFKGVRGELLEEAVRARGNAEEAAASDERISRWIVPLVDAGDNLRRRAQDGLFAGGTGSIESLRRLLDEARARDRQALEAAGRCVRALDLIELIEADLPFYGEWKARQSFRNDEGLDAEFLALLASSTRLARVVQSGIVESGSRRLVAEPDDRSEAALDRVRDLDAIYREVKFGWDRLVAEFQEQAASLSAAGGADRWREIDRLLRVPMIPADVRRGLLRRIRSAAVASTLSVSGEIAPADSPRSEARQAAKASESGSRGEREDDPTIANREARTATDPDFWNQAIALARLDWGLLELGGAPEPDLALLESDFNSARTAARGDPSAAFEAFERLSRRLRTLRAERFQVVRQTQDTNDAILAAADRSIRVIPLAESLGTPDKITETLDRLHRQALLLWHGRRLLGDFAPEHALRVFEDARQVLDTETVRVAENEAAAMSQAQIAVVPRSESDLVVGEWTEKPLQVDLTTRGSFPSGDSVVLVGYDPAQPLTVTTAATRQAAREGVLVTVDPDRRGRSVEYLVQRTDSTSEPRTVPIRLGVFYRGRFFPAERALNVSLVPAKEPVAVTIQQSYEGLPFKDFTDQFKEHPGQGFLHYGTSLKYKLVLTTDRTWKVVVRYGLKEHPESFQTKTLEISPKRRGEIHDLVRGDDFPIVKTNEQLDIAPLTLQVTVFKDKENGEILGKGRFPFRMIPPPQYISVFANFDPSTRLLNLDVVHLANDPVTGPVTIYASIGGQEGWAWIRRSRFVTFAIPIPPTMKKVSWRVGIESMPGAFREEIETPTPQLQEVPRAPAL